MNSPRSAFDPSPWREMSDLEKRAALATKGVRFPAGIRSKGIARSLAAQAGTGGEITPRQAECLWAIIWRYRRQVPDKLLVNVAWNILYRGLDEAAAERAYRRDREDALATRMEGLCRRIERRALELGVPLPAPGEEPRAEVHLPPKVYDDFLTYLRLVSPLARVCEPRRPTFLGWPVRSDPETVGEFAILETQTCG